MCAHVIAAAGREQGESCSRMRRSGRAHAHTLVMLPSAQLRAAAGTVRIERDGDVKMLVEIALQSKVT